MAITRSTEQVCKIALLGPEEKERSKLFKTLCPSSTNYLATSGIEFDSTTSDDPKLTGIKFRIWNTAGQERFRTKVPSFTSGAHVIVICYKNGEEKKEKPVIYTDTTKKVIEVFTDVAKDRTTLLRIIADQYKLAVLESTPAGIAQLAREKAAKEIEEKKQAALAEKEAKKREEEIAKRLKKEEEDRKREAEQKARDEASLKAKLEKQKQEERARFLKTLENEPSTFLLAGINRPKILYKEIEYKEGSSILVVLPNRANPLLQHADAKTREAEGKIINGLIELAKRDASGKGKTIYSTEDIFEMAAKPAYDGLDEAFSKALTTAKVEAENLLKLASSSTTGGLPEEKKSAPVVAGTGSSTSSPGTELRRSTPGLN